MIDGLLLVDKPEGISSFGVVAKVRWVITQEKRRLHQERGFCTDSQAKNASNVCKCKVKVGHTGTLDPAATGLLVLAVGSYTKRVPELIKQDKVYEVTMCLGRTSSTGDKEGQIVPVSDTQPTQQEITDALAQFMGNIMQTPPIYSAIKVNGQRAYDLARKGKEVVIEPRSAVIYSNELQTYDYPFVKFTCKVGSGTYIRSLVEDIGKVLSTGAYMSDLRRTRVGDFSISESIDLTNLDLSNIQKNIFRLP